MLDHGSVVSYFFQAGLIVKTVMLLLLFASMLSWTLIFQRAWFLKCQKNETENFTFLFLESNDLSQFYMGINKEDISQGLMAIFYAGFKEYLRLRQRGQIAIESIQRVMQIEQAKEAVQLQTHLPFFASVGSIAPYIGLFGTVWGIMTSFQALGQAQQATIAMVAPGISEALVATALGLFTAIPAVIAYNRYSTKANALLEQYQLFQDEFIVLIEQQTSTVLKGS